MMKSIVKGITTLGLFCVCILYGYSLNAQNLVSNGGLETWTVMDIPDNWDKYEEVTEETTQVFEGTSSAKHSAGSGTKDMAQVVPITGGEEYTISYRFYDNDDEARTRIWSYWREDGSNITDVNEGLRPSEYSTDLDAWQEVSLTLTAPENATELFFEVRVYNENGASGTGSVFYDNFNVSSTTFIHFTNLDEGQEVPVGTHDFEFGLNNYELTSDGTPFPEIVRLYIDDVLTESVTTQVPMSVELTDPGPHTARVELINLVTGGETPILTSGNVNFTVVAEDLPPSLAITGITEDEILLVDEFSFGTTVENFTVANPSDGDGYIVYNVDGDPNTDIFDASASTTVSGLSNGAHVLTVSLVDNAGVALDPVVTEVINFSVDVPVVLPPSLAITGISEGETFDVSDVSFGTTVGDFVVASASAGDGYITYSLDGADALDIFDADASTLLSSLSDGAHVLTVSLVDNSGAALDPVVSETVNFVVDTGSIFITFDSPMEGDEVNAGDIDFEFTVNNYVFGGPTPFPDVIELFIDGISAGTINTGSTISTNITDLGPHTATLTLTNLVTGEFVPPVSTTINFTVVEDLVLDPVLTLTSPLDGAELEAGNIEFSFELDNFTLAGDDVVSLYINDEFVVSTGSVESLFAELTEAGAYTAYVVLEDQADAFDPAIQSSVINFTIAAEVLPVISFVSPLDGAELDAGTIDFEYLLEDYVLGENDVVELYVDGDLEGSSAVSTTISADVTTGGAHTATFVLTNTVTGDFDPAVEATINFTVTVQLEDQSITLPNGWSIISMNVEPVDPNIATVMAPVVDDIFIVKDQIGNVYWPEFSVNSINDVDVLYGYQVKSNVETTLDVTGVPVDPSTEIPLTEGWSIIGYLPNYDLDAAVAMGSIAADITILKDENGEVYWPLFGINNVGNMTAGKGYQIKMFADNTLVYPAQDLGGGRLTSPVVKQELAHFSKASNTGRNMIIGIPNNAWSTTPEYGDEFAVLDAAGNIAGSTVYTGQNTAITVWGDDDVTSIKDGLLNGEQIRLKYWNKADNKEWLMDVSWVEGDDYYMAEGINVAGTISLREASTEPISLLANMPNPFNETTNLRFYTESNEPIQIKVYNAIGALILEDVISVDTAGYQEYTIDAKEMNSGTYFYHLSNSVFTTTGKMSLIK